MLSLSLILLSAFILLFTYYLLLLKRRYQYFRQRGIPTPPFEFFFGHLKTLWNTPAYHRQLESWTKQYGKIYGVYEGHDPMFVVSDPDFLQEVFVTQFSVFNARKPSVLDKAIPALFFETGENWRRQRHVLNPGFTATKLKGMSPLFNHCVSSLMRKLSDYVENGDEFNISLYYKRLTIDVLCSCAFGIDIDPQNNQSNIYYKNFLAMFSDAPFKKLFLFKCIQVVPQIGVILAHVFAIGSSILTYINVRLLPLLSSTMQLGEMPVLWLRNRAHRIVEHRQQMPIERIDLLQLMLHASPKETSTNTTDGSKENNLLSQEEVVGNIVSFMAAGYETTSATFAYATYELAKHPDILEKLHGEIDELPLFADDSVDDEVKKYSDYDAVAKMPYMNLFFSEVLRMYPTANFTVHRYALEDTVVQGIKIDKGSVVYADMYSVHFDPELWGPDDPYLFVPERHLSKRHPMAFLAFGAGPRHCIGKPFALIEMKIALTRLLRDYTILPGENLENGFKIVDGVVITPEEVWIKLVKRSAQFTD